MKKILSIIAMALCTLTISAQEQNLKVFNRAFEMLCDTTVKSILDNEKFNAYFKKNTQSLNMEVIQVIEDSDSISYCLVEAYKDSEDDFNIAFLEIVNEVVYDEKKFKDVPCFLAGTFTYESTGMGKKTVPYYMTIDAFYSKVKSILDNEIRRRAFQQEE